MNTTVRSNSTHSKSSSINRYVKLGMMEYFITGDHRRQFYDVLGVTPASSADEIRSAYKKLAMKWHPDRWAKDLSLAEEAKKRFQAIQEAYEVLSDQRKRDLLDSGLCDLGTNNSEDVEGFGGFMKEMMTLMKNVRREKKNYSMDELRDMLQGIAHGMNGQDTLWSSMRSTASSSSTSRCGGRSRGRNTKRSTSGVVEVDRTVDAVSGKATKCKV